MSVDAAPGYSRTARNLLVISDLHLGSDIGGAPGAPPPARSRSVDDDLCALLDYYREHGVDGEPWNLVINGDFIDFVGITLDPTDVPVSTEPTPEERAHGLGTAEDHARVKLARVAERHHHVFVALAAFVGARHHLTIVQGNHDREFHWDAVRTDVRRLLLGALGSSGVRAGDGVAFQQRIRFSSWFYWVEGVAYIEHGHQYDSFCATEHVMAPFSPADHRRLSSGFTDVLLRFVVQRTREVRDCNHDQMGVLDYVGLAAHLGLRGGVDLLRRFLSATRELFRLRSLSRSEGAMSLRLEQERRLSQFAETMRIDLGRLRALVELQARPVTRSIRGILASVLIDEMALAAASIVALGIVASIGLRTASFAGTAVLVGSTWWFGHRYLSRSRHVDPQNELAARAAPLARLFPAAFVVMGHTHVPVLTRASVEGATYVNTGSWAEDEGARPDAPFIHRAARTHLVIRVHETGPEAELLAWDSSAGPRRFVTG